MADFAFVGSKAVVPLVSADLLSVDILLHAAMNMPAIIRHKGNFTITKVFEVIHFFNSLFNFLSLIPNAS
jgi:hypothetical protein